MSELKDLFYLGIGSAIIAKEKLEAEAKELMEKGKISKEEQQAFIQKAKDKAKAEEAEFQDRIKSAVRDILSDMGIATKKDIEELKELLKQK
jgi:polyhydroxyalkanoate synthesis regulator phasin